MKLAATCHLLLRHLLAAHATTSQLREGATSQLREDTDSDLSDDTDSYLFEGAVSDLFEDAVSEPSEDTDSGPSEDRDSDLSEYAVFKPSEDNTSPLLQKFQFYLNNKAAASFSHFMEYYQIHDAIESYLSNSDFNFSLNDQNIGPDCYPGIFERDRNSLKHLKRIHLVVGLMMYRAVRGHALDHSDSIYYPLLVLKRWNEELKVNHMTVSLDEVNFNIFTPEEISAILNACPTIRYVNLSYSPSLTSEFISDLNLRYVKELNCSWCKLERLPIPVHCPMLETLILGDNCIQFQYTSPLKPLGQVRRVDLTRNSGVKEADRDLLMTIFPNAEIKISPSP